MKRLLYLSLILSFLIASCSKKEESPDPVNKQSSTNTGGGSGGTGGGGGGGGGGTGGPVQPNLTTSDPIQFWGLFDNALKTFTAGGGSTQATSDNDSLVGFDSTSKYFVAGMLNNLVFEGISSVRGILKYPNGTTAPETGFNNLFTTGAKPFGANTVEIIYSENIFSTWSTSSGDQTGSTFEITQATPTGTPTAPKMKVVMKFACKVYKDDDPTLSKQITQGIMVVEYQLF